MHGISRTKISLAMEDFFGSQGRVWDRCVHDLAAGLLSAQPGVVAGEYEIPEETHRWLLEIAAEVMQRLGRPHPRYWQASREAPDAQLLTQSFELDVKIMMMHVERQQQVAEGVPQFFSRHASLDPRVRVPRWGRLDEAQEQLQQEDEADQRQGQRQECVSNETKEVACRVLFAAGARRQGRALEARDALAPLDLQQAAKQCALVAAYALCELAEASAALDSWRECYTTLGQLLADPGLFRCLKPSEVSIYLMRRGEAAMQLARLQRSTEMMEKLLGQVEQDMRHSHAYDRRNHWARDFLCLAQLAHINMTDAHVSLMEECMNAHPALMRQRAYHVKACVRRQKWKEAKEYVDDHRLLSTGTTPPQLVPQDLLWMHAAYLACLFKLMDFNGVLSRFQAVGPDDSPPELGANPTWLVCAAVSAHILGQTRMATALYGKISQLQARRLPLAPGVLEKCAEMLPNKLSDDATKYVLADLQVYPW